MFFMIYYNRLIVFYTKLINLEQKFKNLEQPLHEDTTCFAIQLYNGNNGRQK